MESVLETGLQARGESESSCPGQCTLCGHRVQTLPLFCLDDLVPVCSECGTSHTLNGHRVYPVEDAVQDCKGELDRSVDLLQKRVCKCDVIKHTCDSALEHNQLETQRTEMQIKEEFKKLHQFLREEEEARITALKEEEQEKRKKMKARREKVEEMMEFISDTISRIEREMDDVEFQETYDETVKRVWKCEKRPQKFFRTLIDVPKHVGNLRFKVWEKMMEKAPCFPVTLDPNSASTFLAVSPGLNQVQYQEGQQPFPLNVPECFNPNVCVLGSEDITSSEQSWNYSWDVDVGQSSNWTLGVAKVSVKQDEIFEACPEAGLWTISLRDGEYHAMTSPCLKLELNGHRPQQIRMCVDFKSRCVSFADPETNTHLYTFSNTSRETLIPYFQSICPEQPLVILPQKVSVVIEKHELPDEDQKVTEDISNHRDIE